MGVKKNRVANQFADGGTISHPSANHLPFLLCLTRKIQKKNKKNTHYEERYRDGWYTTNRVSNQFKVGAILAIGLHLDSVGLVEGKGYHRLFKDPTSLGS